MHAIGGEMIRTVLAAGAVALFAAGPATAQTTLTVSGFGIAQDQFRRILYAPFEAQCGCRIAVEAGNSAERLAKMEARKANPEIDIAVLSDADAMIARTKDLIEPVDVAKLSNHAKLYDIAKDPIGGNFAVGYTFYNTSIVYRTDKVKIESWKDLWKPELKGRLALPNITTTQGPLLLFMTDRAFGGAGGAYATAIDRIAEVKPNVVTFYERSAQLLQLFQQDEIWAAPLGRFNWANIKKLNMPLAWATPTEGQTGGINVMVVTKNGKNRELALRFMDMWLSTDIQTKLAMELVDSPANKEVVLPADVADNLTYGAETVNAVRLIPPADVLANRDAWLAGWNAKVAR